MPLLPQKTGDTVSSVPPADVGNSLHPLIPQQCSDTDPLQQRVMVHHLYLPAVLHHFGDHRLGGVGDFGEGAAAEGAGAGILRRQIAAGRAAVARGVEVPQDDQGADAPLVGRAERLIQPHHAVFPLCGPP
jgi:hypothetical protein